MIGNPSFSESVSKRSREDDKIIARFVTEFRNIESVCFPLQTRYATNDQIFNCANFVLKYEYADNVKLAESGANKRLANCLTPFNEASKLTSSLPQELLKELIARPLVYIDKDMVRLLFGYTLVCGLWHIPIDRIPSAVQNMQCKNFSGDSFALRGP